ncbi:MAG TPA: bifunctional isocitrate dehydrogenase kinase/phosphatase [Vicinamibacteria bacterium]|nr:bifunctional isocitrate dehydrogenase kinase/phosphatase [Vicinamibacteria bacterium]
MSGPARAADAVAGAWQSYFAEFLRITRRARARFEARQWREAQRDSVERLALYRAVLTDTLHEVRRVLGEEARDRDTWREVKDRFAAGVDALPTRELAHTYFNSVTRRIWTIVGIAPELEFVDLVGPAASFEPRAGVTEVVSATGDLGPVLATVLRRHDWPGWEDLPRDTARAARALVSQLPGGLPVAGLEMARAVFFRNKAAYLVGRIRPAGGPGLPFALAVLNPRGRAVVDAVLVGEDDVTAVFSFTRSYFFVDSESPRALVGFLRELLPRKPVAELYSSIGFNRHGKTELYRSLLRHVAASRDLFEIAPGARGMVMLVFTLPSYDVVFKVIRERFDPPKATSRTEVMQKYQLVFEHDRAGRLIDAQEFENLAFDRARFSPGLLAELAARTGDTVSIDERRVILRHLYTERRVTPLDLYLRHADAEAARQAVLDYGQAVRDLARTNIFPGDLLLKNFGVTRLRRVVFYDYDELCLVTDCHFRELPAARDEDEESAREPWFYVGEKDIFPEELMTFIGLRGGLKDVFLAAHGDLLDPRFWNDLQDRHRAGEVLDLFPYPPEKRLG